MKDDDSQMKVYFKDGKRCLLCVKRKKLIQITPEEIVRQNFTKRLIKEYSVPPNMIEIEFPLSRLKKFNRGRVDILVFAKNEDSSLDPVPVILVECKEPNTVITNSLILTDSLSNQLSKYLEVLTEVDVVIATNSRELMVYGRIDGEYYTLEEIPNYSTILGGENFVKWNIKSDSFRRRNHIGQHEENYNTLQHFGEIGKKTDEKFVSLLTNLVGLINDQNESLLDLKLRDRRFIEDGGIRLTKFGNAGGGSYPGNYRFFIVKNKDDSDIISVSIMANRSGTTYFLVAIDNFEKSHLSLQLAIDKHVKKIGNSFEFWHDGSLTAGSHGRLKNQVVIDFVKKKNPNLVRKNMIYLGKLDNNRPFVWSSDDVRNFIANFIDYAFLRDEIRKKVIFSR